MWEHQQQPVSLSPRVTMATEGGVASLTMVGVVRGDQGEYMCTALNSAGSASIKTSLTVLGEGRGEGVGRREVIDA